LRLPTSSVNLLGVVHSCSRLYLPAVAGEFAGSAHIPCLILRDKYSVPASCTKRTKRTKTNQPTDRQRTVQQWCNNDFDDDNDEQRANARKDAPTNDVASAEETKISQSQSISDSVIVFCDFLFIDKCGFQLDPLSECYPVVGIPRFMAQVVTSRDAGEFEVKPPNTTKPQRRATN